MLLFKSTYPHCGSSGLLMFFTLVTARSGDNSHNLILFYRIMKTILQHLKPHYKRLVIVMLMHTLATLTELLMPYVMSDVVDMGIREANIRRVIFSSSLMLILALLSLTSALASNKINTKVTTDFSASLSKATFKKINSLSFEQYSKIGSSGLLTRSTDDISNVEWAASQLVYTIVTVPMMLIGGTALALLADVTLSLIFLLCIPIILIFVVFIVKPLRQMWDISDKYVDVQNRIVRERLIGIRVIRAFNNEDKEHSRARFATEEMAKYMIKANVRSGYITPVAMLLLNLSTVAILLVGSARVESGAITEAGDIIAVMQYVTLIANAVINLSWTIAWIPHLRVSVSRISEVFDMPVCDDGSDNFTDPRFPLTEGAKVEMRDVSFAYPDSPTDTLTDINFYADSGETVALIGGTGSGKSTLVKVLLAMYPYKSGDITVNGVNYNELSKGEIRLAYSVSLQKAMIFEGTVRDNITMGRSDATDEEIRRTLSDVELDGFISSLEEGLDYLLVGLGQNVSGGQKQRINMARTVIREAPIYIFDDSFSALDYLTERKIQQKLFARLRGRTKILVTQRVSTALAADRIYVMDRGRVSAVGTHRELIRSSDIYREICVSQLGERALGGDVSEE